MDNSECYFGKKIVFLVVRIMILILVSNFLILNAEACSESSSYGVKYYRKRDEFKETENDRIVLKDRKKTAAKLKKGSVIVNVKTMCDTKYQKLHKKDWKIRAKLITIDATEKLYDRFNIYFNVKKAVKYKSNSSNNPFTLLKKLRKKYKPGKKADMVVAFSGKKPKYIAGITYIGKIAEGPRILVFASSYNSETETVQHEIGHTYSLNHCNKHCVMAGEGFGYLNKFCKVHKKHWKETRTYYKTRIKK